MKRQYHLVAWRLFSPLDAELQSLYQVRGASDKKIFTAQSPEASQNQLYVSVVLAPPLIACLFPEIVTAQGLGNLGACFY